MSELSEAFSEIAKLRDRCTLLERAVACFAAREIQSRGWDVDDDIKRAIAGAPCRLNFAVVNGVIDLAIEVDR